MKGILKINIVENNLLETLNYKFNKHIKEEEEKKVIESDYKKVQKDFEKDVQTLLSNIFNVDIKIRYDRPYTKLYFEVEGCSRPLLEMSYIMYKKYKSMFYNRYSKTYVSVSNNDSFYIDTISEYFTNYINNMSNKDSSIFLKYVLMKESL
jgi:hypothetical protein